MFLSKLTQVVKGIIIFTTPSCHEVHVWHVTSGSRYPVKCHEDKIYLHEENHAHKFDHVLTQPSSVRFMVRDSHHQIQTSVNYFNFHKFYLDGHRSGLCRVNY